MKRLASIAATIAIFGFQNHASAADMPVKAPVAKAAVAEIYNWSGFYVGGHAGYGWDPKDVAFGPGTAVTAIFFGLNEFPTSLSPDANGFIGGGQIGFNWQLANVVLGIEADFSGSAIKGSETLTPTPVGVAVFATTAEKKVPWLGTLRGRLGVPVNSWLFYATGGLAFGKTELSFTTVPTAFACPGFTCAAGSVSSTKTGWVLGGGVEYGLTRNWTLRAEYLYIDLGSQSLTALSDAPGFAFTTSTRFNENIVRGAVNYRF